MEHERTSPPVAQSLSQTRNKAPPRPFMADRSLFTHVQGNLTAQPPVPYPITAGMLPSRPPNTSETTGSETYCSELSHQGGGFPLYVPGPQAHLPPEYRRRGIAIGDVGQVTPEGSFDFFFNIYLPADHPINANGPEAFVPLPPYKPVDVEQLDYEPGDFVSSPSVASISSGPCNFPGGIFGFNCMGPNGAVLCLHQGSHLEILLNLASMRQYATKHAESWYKYFNARRERGIENGELDLITGSEKAQSWGMATFENASLQGPFQLSFRPTRGEDEGYRYRWQGDTEYYECKHADSPPVGTPPNHTIFIHALRISVGQIIWEKGFGVKVRQDSSVFLDKSPYESQESSFLWSIVTGAINSVYSWWRQSTRLGIVTDAFPIPKVIHPSRAIHERIFREAPHARVVITHDDDWRDVLKDDATQMAVHSSEF
ncbi:hypothetical protein B0H12DRAFT_702731 [Mycena haematopus]|nr:hypothetical protein B0H12DRAFT_702731 [Mycena haematopus]